MSTTTPLDDMPDEAIAYYIGAQRRRVAFVPIASQNRQVLQILRSLRRAGFIRLSKFRYEGRPMARIHWRGKR